MPKVEVFILLSYLIPIAAPFRSIYPKPNYQFTFQDFGVLNCSTYGIDLNNYWTFQKLGSNSENRIEQDSTYKYQTDVDGSLIIYNIHNDDIGTYKCISTNLFGTIISITKIDTVISTFFHILFYFS